MLITGSLLKVLDNSAPAYVKCIHIYNKSCIGFYNNLILAVVMRSVQNLKINQKSKNNLLKGTLCKAIIVQLTRKFQRKDGTSIKFDSNSCIILNKQMGLAGTRIIGPVAFEIMYSALSSKFVTLAPLVI